MPTDPQGLPHPGRSTCRLTLTLAHYATDADPGRSSSSTSPGCERHSGPARSYPPASTPHPSTAPQRTVCQFRRGIKIGRRSPRLRSQIGCRNTTIGQPFRFGDFFSALLNRPAEFVHHRFEKSVSRCFRIAFPTAEKELFCCKIRKPTIDRAVALSGSA